VCCGFSELTTGEAKDETIHADAAETFITGPSAGSRRESQETLRATMRLAVLVNPGHLLGHDALATPGKSGSVVGISDVSAEEKVKRGQAKSCIISSVIHRAPL
jgi:hypothetical protein